MSKQQIQLDLHHKSQLHYTSTISTTGAKSIPLQTNRFDPCVAFFVAVVTHPTHGSVVPPTNKRTRFFQPTTTRPSLFHSFFVCCFRCSGFSSPFWLLVLLWIGETKQNETKQNKSSFFANRRRRHHLLRRRPN
jgi:hypothetical protein